MRPRQCVGCKEARTVFSSRVADAGLAPFGTPSTKNPFRRTHPTTSKKDKHHPHTYEPTQQASRPPATRHLASARTAMAWYDEDSWLTAAFAPTPSTILFTLALALVLPILVHYFLYRKTAAATLPTFLLVGPMEGGKTALLTLVRCPCRLTIS